MTKSVETKQKHKSFSGILILFFVFFYFFKNLFLNRKVPAASAEMKVKMTMVECCLESSSGRGPERTADPEPVGPLQAAHVHRTKQTKKNFENQKTDLLHLQGKNKQTDEQR